MRKTKRFGVGGETDEEGKKGVMGGYNRPTVSRDAPAKRIVSAETVKEAGFTNLRDYLNAEKGLKRKGESKVTGPDESAAETKRLSRVPSASAAEMAERPKREKAQALEEVHPEDYVGGMGLKALARAAKSAAAPVAKEVAKRVEPYIATKAQEAAKKGAATKAKKAADKKAAEYAADEARMGGEGGGFKRGGNVKRYATGGSVAVKKTEEPPIPKATQESMKRQAAQEKADRKQAEEQKAGEREVRENMGRKWFAKGGSVSSASRRADGCAIRGKTRA